MKPVASMYVVIVILALLAATVLVIIYGPLVTPPRNTGTSAVGGEAEAITIAGDSFNPSNLTIPVGATVTWTNPTNSSIINSLMIFHRGNVTALATSGVIRPSLSFSYTFAQAGAYEVRSGIQYFMNGTINVALPDGTVPEGNQTISTGNATVNIEDFAFDPTPLNISSGTTVTWNNIGGGEDAATHTVTIIEGPEKFNSGYIQPDDSFSFTFTKPGTYRYMCLIHPFMFGQVVVT